jgi:hypothetical protein
MQDTTTGLIKASDGTAVLGVAKWNHATSMLAVAVDEPVVMSGTTAHALAHGNVSNVKVASALLMLALFTPLLPTIPSQHKRYNYSSWRRWYY